MGGKVIEKVYILYDGKKSWWFQREIETEMPNLNTYAEQIRKSLRGTLQQLIIADNYIAWETFHFAVAHVFGNEPNAIFGVPLPDSEDKAFSVAKEQSTETIVETITETKEKQKIEQLSFF